jgi:hypothetical protein
LFLEAASQSAQELVLPYAVGRQLDVGVAPRVHDRHGGDDRPGQHVPGFRRERARTPVPDLVTQRAAGQDQHAQRQEQDRRADAQADTQ